MRKPLTVTQFKSGDVEAGDVVNDVPVIPATQNPVILTLVSGVVVSFLMKIFQVDYLMNLFPSLDAAWAGFASDFVLMIVVSLIAGVTV